MYSLWNLTKSLAYIKYFFSPAQRTMSYVPSKCVSGMKTLDKTAFDTKLTVPRIKIEASKINFIKRYIRFYLLKLENFKSVLTIEGTDPEIKQILLKPEIKNLDCMKEHDRHGLMEFGIPEEDFELTEVKIGYEHFRCDDILRAILPPDNEGLTSYSRIGHIVHVNLHEHLVLYKQIIGQVLLEKIHGARTVLNKTDAIDNTYRNFRMEILCGEPDLKASVKENHCTFELDFGLVYWNPRLSSEHERICGIVQKGDVLYDVFAGIGPFAVPAAKKGAEVLANDLNPESFKWLEHNTKLNKVKIQCTNKDGRAFIVDDVKKDLIQRWESKFSNKIHITMNLPALATTFLGTFRGLLPEELAQVTDGPLPVCYVYCFVKDFDPEETALKLVEEELGYTLSTKEVKLVRKVSPSKLMMKVTFTLPREVLFGIAEATCQEPPAKRTCAEGDISSSTNGNVNSFPGKPDVETALSN